MSVIDSFSNSVCCTVLQLIVNSILWTRLTMDFKIIVRQLLNHFCWIDSGWARLYPCCDFFWFCSIFLFSQDLQWSIWMNFVQQITEVNLRIFSSNDFLFIITFVNFNQKMTFLFISKYSGTLFQRKYGKYS